MYTVHIVRISRVVITNKLYIQTGKGRRLADTSNKYCSACITYYKYIIIHRHSVFHKLTR